VSIGESLADARRRSGLSVSQVSQQTRIRESIIRDIERGDFSACGGDFYARGHIRSIATAVGADPVPLISEYDAEHGPPHALRAADVFEPSRPIKIRERRSPRLGMIVVLVLLAIIGYAAYHLVSTRGDKSGHNVAAISTHSQTPSPTPSPTLSPSPTASPTPTDVVINVDAAREDCWVLVTRASDGSQIYEGVIPAGSSMTWTETEAVDIRLGNPGGINLTVDGKPESINTVFPVTLSFSPQTGSASATPSG
jgi:cytoskeletal protein RodZ